MAKEMERKNLERKLERIADDRAERMSDANPIYRPCRAQDQLRKTSRFTAPAKPGGGVPELPALPGPAEPSPTCRLCPRQVLLPKCLLCRSQKVSRIFRLCPNQKPVVREIFHPCRRFHQISNRGGFEYSYNT